MTTVRSGAGPHVNTGVVSRPETTEALITKAKIDSITEAQAATAFVSAFETPPTTLPEVAAGVRELEEQFAELQSRLAAGASLQLRLLVAASRGSNGPRSAGLTLPQWQEQLAAPPRAVAAAAERLRVSPNAAGAREEISAAVASMAQTLRSLAQELQADPAVARDLRTVLIKASGHAAQNAVFAGAILEARTETESLKKELSGQAYLYQDSINVMRDLVRTQLRFEPTQATYAQQLGRIEEIRARIETEKDEINQGRAPAWVGPASAELRGLLAQTTTVEDAALQAIWPEAFDKAAIENYMQLSRLR